MDTGSATTERAALLTRLRALHTELGIPSDYAATRRLEVQPEAVANALVDAGATPDGRRVQLVASAAEAWRRLSAGAAREGIALQLWSGFRSIDRQAELIRRKLAAGMSIDDVLKMMAAPGYSEHHTGCAIDVGTPGDSPLEETFERTDAFGWLTRRAPSFGFMLSYPRANPAGIAYEPWHWRWREGRTIALMT